MKLIFLPVDKHQRFLHIILQRTSKEKAKHVQITQNIKFGIFCNLKKKVRNEVDFFCMQISMIISYKIGMILILIEIPKIFDADSQAFLKFPK